MIKHLGLLNSVPSRYGGGKAGYELNFTERKQVLFLVWGWPKGSLWVKLAQKKTSYNSDGKESSCNSWIRKIPWRRKWQPTPSILAWKISWTEKPGRLQSMGFQSWTWLNDWHFHFQANFLYLRNKLDLHTVLLGWSPSICTELLVFYMQSITQYSLHLLFHLISQFSTFLHVSALASSWLSRWVSWPPCLYSTRG